jgi:hypothetical protein
MNEQDNELFEVELRRLKPARLPDELQSRLEAAIPQPPPHRDVQRPPRVEPSAWWLWLRWLAPASAVALVLLLVVAQGNRNNTGTPPGTAAAEQPMKADQVEIDRKLLASFDTVASLPDGEPVRFRCREWVDAVTLRDSVRGVEVINRTPRIEVVPVSFESY